MVCNRQRSRIVAWTLGLIGGTLIAAPIATLSAQLTASQRDELLSNVAQDKGRFDPGRLPDLGDAQRRIAERIEAVRAYFERATDADNFAAWMEYLDLEPLERAIRSDDSLTRQARAAIGLGQRLVAAWPGLELEVLRELRAAVDDLIAAVRFRDPERSRRVIERELDQLADVLRDAEGIPTADQLARITASIDVLDDSGQPLVTLPALRETFDRPNLLFWVGEPLVGKAVNRPVDRRQPVRDCILGTRLVGQARLVGDVTADVVPCGEAALVRVSMSGRMRSENTGYNGPVRLKSVGSGDIHVGRQLWFDATGLRMGAVEADVSLQTRIQAICHPLRLVRRIARKRAARQKPLADRIATAKLRRRVSAQFREDTGRVVALGSGSPTDRARAWLQRLDVVEPVGKWRSTHEAVYVRAAVARRNQLGAVVAAPQLAETFQFAVQIHESAIDNALAKLLGGRTVGQSEIRRLLSLRREARGESGSGETRDETGGNGSQADGDPFEDEPPFEIDFSRFRPVIFEARDGAVRLGVRGTRFEQGDRELDQPLEITAVYRPVKAADGALILRRGGEISVDFPGSRRLTVSQTAVRSSLKKLFDGVFPEQLLDQRLAVPETSVIEALRGLAFVPDRLESQDGWLTLMFDSAAGP